MKQEMAHAALPSRFARRPGAVTASCLLLALTALFAPAVQAAEQPKRQADPGIAIVSERGQNHRVWSRQEVVSAANGHSRTNFHSYVELA